MSKMLDQLLAARRVSVPLVAITTPDPADTQAAVCEALSRNGKGGAVPLLAWDVIRALRGLNDAGVQEVQRLTGGGEDAKLNTGRLDDTLALLADAQGETEKAKGVAVFIHQAHRYLGEPVVAQGVWNLRDRFKADRRTLILLAPELTLPPELRQDVVVLDDPLPDDVMLGAIIAEQHKAAGLSSPDDPADAVAAVRGLAAFPAEQVVAMSLTKKGLDLDNLWERKRKLIESTQGLGVDRERITFGDVGGQDAIKAFLSGLFNGGRPPRVVVRVDEIEKMLAGADQRGAGDSTGVSQDALGVVLREMEDNDYTGILALGPAGSGKTLISKALAGEFGIVSMTMDFGAMKGQYVGQSEAAVRSAFKTIGAVAGKGGALVVATCNSLDVLPPALRRRFKLGIWYFDLPTRNELDVIWTINLKRYGLDTQELPDDSHWVGADVRNCCDVAWRLGSPLKKAAGYIVPAAKTDPEAVDRLRRMANGRFLSAAVSGTYRHAEDSELKDWLRETRKVEV
mgnify:FL=1